MPGACVPSPSPRRGRGPRELRRARRPRRSPRRRGRDVVGPPRSGGLPCGVIVGVTVVLLLCVHAAPLPDPPSPDAASWAASQPASLISLSFLHLIFSNPQSPLHCQDKLLRVRQIDCRVLHPLCISVSVRVFGPARCCHRSSADPPRSRARTSFPVLAATGPRVSVPKPQSKGGGAPPLTRVRGQMVCRQPSFN